MGLEEYRKEIDRIDAEIVRLYEERMDVAEKVALDKIQSGKNVYDPEREKSKLEKIKNMTKNEFNSLGAVELFSEIMAMSRKRQYALLEEKHCKKIE